MTRGHAGRRDEGATVVQIRTQVCAHTRARVSGRSCVGVHL